jgi:hypothetical protein
MADQRVEIIRVTALTSWSLPHGSIFGVNWLDPKMPQHGAGDNRQHEPNACSDEHDPLSKVWLRPNSCSNNKY